MADAKPQIGQRVRITHQPDEGKVINLDPLIVLLDGPSRYPYEPGPTDKIEVID